MLPLHNTDQDPPPFFGSWKRIYFSVLFYLFTLIVVLWGITKYFACD